MDTDYPKFAAWTRQSLPQVATDPMKANVWGRFLSRSWLAADWPTALDAISPDGTRAPDLLVRDLDDYAANGLFKGDSPNEIQIAEAVVVRFEQYSDDARMQQLVEAIILHELIHWAHYRAGTFDIQTGTDDPGSQFELASYGKYSGRFWLDQASPFLDAGFSDTRGIRSSG